MYYHGEKREMLEESGSPVLEPSNFDFDGALEPQKREREMLQLCSVPSCCLWVKFSFDGPSWYKCLSLPEYGEICRHHMEVCVPVERALFVLAKREYESEAPTDWEELKRILFVLTQREYESEALIDWKEVEGNMEMRQMKDGDAREEKMRRIRTKYKRKRVDPEEEEKKKEEERKQKAEEQEIWKRAAEQWNDIAKLAKECFNLDDVCDLGIQTHLDEVDSCELDEGGNYEPYEVDSCELDEGGNYGPDELDNCESDYDASLLRLLSSPSGERDYLVRNNGDKVQFNFNFNIVNYLLGC